MSHHIQHNRISSLNHQLNSPVTIRHVSPHFLTNKFPSALWWWRVEKSARYIHQDILINNNQTHDEGAGRLLEPWLETQQLEGLYHWAPSDLTKTELMKLQQCNTADQVKSVYQRKATQTANILVFTCVDQTVTLWLMKTPYTSEHYLIKPSFQ